MRVSAPILVLLAVAPALRAWPASPRSFASLNEIPVLAAGTVEEVVPLRVMPAGTQRFPWEDRRIEARIVVRRVFTGPARQGRDSDSLDQHVGSVGR